MSKYRIEVEFPSNTNQQLCKDALDKHGSEYTENNDKLIFADDLSMEETEIIHEFGGDEKKCKPD